MPLIINEPLSLLQRLAETLEYSFLLTKADDQSDPVLRMEVTHKRPRSSIRTFEL